MDTQDNVRKEENKIAEDTSEVIKNYTPRTESQPTTPDFFSGFEIKYPEYEVVTPQTLQSLTIRSLNVSEEETLKGSLVTRRKVPEHITRVLYSTIVQKPSSWKTYDDFLSSVTMLDRDAMLYGMYHISYRDKQTYDVQCSNHECATKYTINVNLDDAFQMDAYPGDPMEILSARLQVPLNSIKDTYAIIKQPTLKDEQLMLSDMLFQSDDNLLLGVEMLTLDSMIRDPAGRTPMVINSRDDMFRAYSKLPAFDRKAITKAYIENFGKYSMNLKIDSYCSSCGKKTEVSLNIMDMFFRSLYQ